VYFSHKLQRIQIAKYVESIFDLSRQYFAKPDEEKLSLAREAELNIGYVAVERERLDSTKKGDLKEAFNGRIYSSLSGNFLISSSRKSKADSGLLGDYQKERGRRR